LGIRIDVFVFVKGEGRKIREACEQGNAGLPKHDSFYKSGTGK